MVQNRHCVAGFVNEHSFGRATVQDGADVRVVVHTTVEQAVILSISGFYACLAAMFGVEYDGWGCEAQSIRN